MICPECCGDGKETCTNPEHGLIQALTFHDIGRIGCPCCGHDEFHKVENGGSCEICSGSGKVTDHEFEQYCDGCDLDVSEHIQLVKEVNNRLLSLNNISK